MNNDDSSLYRRIRRAISSFGATEKLIFIIFAVIFIATSLFLLEKLNRSLMTDIPVRGGTLEEGIVGYASTINPILAYTDADKDLTSLIYSGLLKSSPTGDLIPDLAESWTISEDGLTYDFKIKEAATFQDGMPVTADDIIFTIEKIGDPVINSPKAANWAGVTVTKVNDKELTFTLKKAYEPFLENLTLGILPKHMWQVIESPLFSRSTYNQQPIGSGPYMIKTAKSRDGFYEYYDLVPFKKYVLGQANIEHVIIRFYKNEESAIAAYQKGTIKALGGISPEGAEKIATEGGLIKRIPLPRVFALFFNQSQSPVLLNKEIRQALDVAVNRNALIQEILKGYGVPATSPIPSGFGSVPNIVGSNPSATSTVETASSSESVDQSIEDAKDILTKNGWKLNEQGIMEKKVTKDGKSETQQLKFGISTSNVPELNKTAEIISNHWKLIGADVTLQIYEPSDLNQKVIRPRKYDTLLFGNVVGKDLDLYPFWHSSQRNDPGLNIAQYTNVKTDKLLETARATASSTVRENALQAFEKEVLNDIPAIFLYSPEYIYIMPKSIENAEISKITSPADRFMTINKWYTETEGVWNIFIRN